MKKPVLIIFALCIMCGTFAEVYGQELSKREVPTPDTINMDIVYRLGSNAVLCETDDKTKRKISAKGILRADNEANVFFDGTTAVEFTSSERIILKPGFAVKPGSNFKAYIEDCECCNKSAISEPEVLHSSASIESLKDNRVSLFPNPFTKGVTVRYKVDNNMHVRIGIYDIIGKLVAKPLDQKQEAGMHSLFIDTKNLRAGAYLYQVVIGNRQYSKKMIKVN